jgi:hypothetical protein
MGEQEHVVGDLCAQGSESDAGPLAYRSCDNSLLTSDIHVSLAWYPQKHALGHAQVT